MSETPSGNIRTAIDYIAATYGDDMSYWKRTNEHPNNLPVHEREAWHRDAWDREQVALAGIIRQDPRETEREVFRASMRSDAA